MPNQLSKDKMRTSIIFPKALWAEIKRCAAKMNISANSLVMISITEFLNKQKNKEVVNS